MLVLTLMAVTAHRLICTKLTTYVFSIASCVLSILLVVLVVAVMKWKKKDEEEMRLKEEEYMSRRVSAANIARTKVTFRNNIIRNRH